MEQREQQRRVGQKLAYARWHLEWCQQLAANEQQRAALLESACWHALGAYRAFLVEIAADAHHLVDHDNAEIVDAVSLSKVYSDYLPAALAECANLENQQGWLQQLFCWSESINRSDALIVPRAGADVIAVGSDSPQNLESASLLQSLGQLEVLIERLRADMLEF